MKSINSQIQEAQITSNTGNMKKITQRHNMLRSLKTSDKEKKLKSSHHRRHILYRETQIKMVTDFSMKAM